MTTSSAVFCPDCNAEISAEVRTCAECGADVGRWPESQRTPLILPGNPALSADVVRKRISVPKVVGGAVLVTAVVGGVLYNMPEKQVDDRMPPVVVAGPRMATDAGDVPPSSDVAAGAASLPPAPVAADARPASSYGDTAFSRTVADPARRVAPPVPVTPPVVAPRTAAVPPAAAPRNASPSPVPRPTAPTSAVLRMLPLVSNTLRPGERVQLRWSVTDGRSRRAVPARLEFTSTDASVMTVNPRDGIVIARAPGTASIIVDGGAAGRTTVRLTVRAPAASQVVTVAPAAAVEPPRVATSTPTATATAAPQISVPSLTPAREMPDAGDVRSVVDRFIRDVRNGTIRNFELQQFLGDGADHSVRLIDSPSTTRTTTYNIRIAFDLRLSKYDGGGRPVTRIATITMDVEKRDSQAVSSAITIGPLLRP